MEPVADSGCLRGRGKKNKKGTSCMQHGVWHCIAFSPLEGHPRGHFTMFCLLEGHPRGHFIMFRPLIGQPRGHFTTFSPLEGHPRGHKCTKNRPGTKDISSKACLIQNVGTRTLNGIWSVLYFKPKQYLSHD